MSERKHVPAAALRCVVGSFELGDNGEGAKTAPFRMVARTGNSIDHWYWGKVVHDLAGMRLHKDRLPIDYVHDDKEVIGYANRFDVESGDLEVSGALVPYRDNDRASEIVHKSREGVPYEASINFGGDGIAIEEFKPGELVNVNGREFAGPVTVIRQWPLRGIAICPYGADANTSTSFADAPQCEVTVMKHNETKLDATPEAEAEVQVTEAVEVVEVFDTPAEAEPVVVPAVEAEQPLAVNETTEATAASRTGQDYLDRFGDRGGVWFAQGLSWDDCVVQHEKSLLSRISELEQQNKDLRGKLSFVNVGEADPVELSQEVQQPRRGVAGKVRILGRQYKE